MTTESFKKAKQIISEIDTLESEIRTLSNMESNTRADKECTHRLGLKKLFKKPTKKTAFNYWSSQDLDSIHSIVLFDADEVKALVEVKQSKVERLKAELSKI